MRLGPQEYAWLFLPCILGIMAGAHLSGRAAGRHAPAATVRRAYAFMATAAVANLAYSFSMPPSIPWAVLPIMVYGVGFAMAMPSITLITLDLFPTRRGMAASLQGFVSGMVNTLTAGIVSPALSHDTRSLALGMAAMLAAGLASWLAYVRMAHRKAEEPEPIGEP